MNPEKMMQIEREAHSSMSLGPDADDFVIELIEIGQNSDFISDPGDIFNKKWTTYESP